MPPAPQPTGSAKNLIQNTAAGFFIACVAVLSIISIFGVWEIFSDDVILKSFQTLGLLAFVAVVVIVASRFVGDPSATEEVVPNPAFRAVRNVTLATLIGSSAFLAFLGVLSIWEVITDKDILFKTLGSLCITAFSSLIIVMVCLEREKNKAWEKHSGQITGGTFIAGVILIWLFAALFFN